MDEIQELELKIKQHQEEIERLKKAKEEINNPIPFDPVGAWQVSTEGDCEGRSMVNLGTFEGNILDIARNLSGKAYYQLTFSRAKMNDIKPNIAKSKCVDFTICNEKGIRLFNENDQLRAVSQYLRDGEKLGDSRYYGCIKLTWDK